MIDQAMIDAAVAKHGAAVVVRGAGEEVLVRRPTRDDWVRFRKLAMGWKRHRAAETLLRACVVHPTGRELDALLERKPAAAEMVVDKLLELAGADPHATATFHGGR